MFFFLPYATDRPRRRIPVVTYVLLAANMGVFVFLEVPYWLNGGQGVGPFAFRPDNPSVDSLLMSMFSHGGIGHIFGNMLFLWLFGSVVEDVLGPVLFIGFYFGGQMGATLMDVSMTRAFDPAGVHVPRVGASGAIAGILGLSAVCFSRVRVRVAYFLWILFLRVGVARVQSWVFLGVWVAWQLVGGVVSTWAAAAGGPSGGVAHWAHIGGFGIGVLGAYALGLPERIRRFDLLSGVSYAPDDGTIRYAELADVVRQTPEDAQAWLALARSTEGYGFSTKAAEAYARAAILFLQQHEPEKAAQAYRGVLRYDSTFTLSAEQQFDVALGLARIGDLEASLAALSRLIESYPDSPQVEVALVRAGELAEKLGNHDTARRYFEQVVRRYPSGEWGDYARQKMGTGRG
jgi:membrane associated rhomboid family serine protease/Tfp pilus assembly protein PilF